MSLAGTYYVAVSLSNDHGKTYQVPYDLAVDVAGTVRGEPAYEEAGPTPAPATTSPSPTDSPTPSDPAGTEAAAAPKADDGSTTSARVGWVAGGVGALAVIGAGVALIVHRARHRSDQAGPRR